MDLKSELRKKLMAIAYMTYQNGKIDFPKDWFDVYICDGDVYRKSINIIEKYPDLVDEFLKMYHIEKVKTRDGYGFSLKKAEAEASA